MPRERTYLRYQLYRSRARQLANFSIAQPENELEPNSTRNNVLASVRFEAINVEALTAFSLWDEPHFSWNEVIAWKAKEPLALDLAIWFGLELCGLCFANPNNSRLRVRIVRLEGKPGRPSLLKNRIAPLALIAVEHYARIIGSTLIEIQEPAEGAAYLSKTRFRVRQ